MKVDEIVKAWVNKDDHGPRELGRYWASDISSITGGYLTPKSFFNKKEVDNFGVKLITSGIANEDMLTKIFTEMNVPFKAQVKKEMRVSDEIVLVVKPDFVFKNFVLETKYPYKPIRNGEIPLRYALQLECEHRAFHLPVYLGVFGYPFNVKTIAYAPSRKRWSHIVKALTEFHQKLKVEQKKLTN